MHRTSIIAVCALGLALVACRDLGLEDNVPLEEAMQQPPLDLVAAVHAPADGPEPLIIDGRLWRPSGVPITTGTGELRPVGSAGGTTVYARSWDRPPYDEVFARIDPAGPDAGTADDDGPWQPFAPVLGRSGAIPGTGAAGAGAGAGVTPTEEPDAGEPGAAADTADATGSTGTGGPGPEDPR